MSRSIHHSPSAFRLPPSALRLPPSAFTLVEILVATTLALLLLGAVVVMFGRVGEAITDSRSMLEAAERLRLAEVRLQMDLSGVTVPMNPPRKPEDNEGYFEYIEGPASGTSTIAVNTDVTSIPYDPTVGDFDDILMFTTRSADRPFVGKCGTITIQSDVAEVAWFLRGRNLHRRVLLVAPGAPLAANTTNFYTNYDISASTNASGTIMMANTLGDLTRRECRYAHTGSFPYPTPWNWSVSGTYTSPTLPTLNECSSSGWLPAITTGSVSVLDFWTNNILCRVADSALSGGTNSTRVADDVILTNVIGFDVKAWDPTANAGQGMYVDLGMTGIGRFGVVCNSKSGLSGGVGRIYDTWSTHYESVGISVGTPGQALNGLDDGGVANGIVDDDGEKLTSPPYPYPLRGIQVKIRVFEPDSRQIREVTVVQDFLPQ